MYNNIRDIYMFLVSTMTHNNPDVAQHSADTKKYDLNAASI